MTLQGSGRCRTLPGPAALLLDGSEPKVGMPRFCVVGWENWSFLWSRQGVLSDFSSALLFVHSGRPDWEGSQSKEIRAASSGWSLHGTRPWR